MVRDEMVRSAPQVAKFAKFVYRASGGGLALSLLILLSGFFFSSDNALVVGFLGAVVFGWLYTKLGRWYRMVHFLALENEALKIVGRIEKLREDWHQMVRREGADFHIQCPSCHGLYSLYPIFQNESCPRCKSDLIFGAIPRDDPKLHALFSSLSRLNDKEQSAYLDLEHVREEQAQVSYEIELDRQEIAEEQQRAEKREWDRRTRKIVQAIKEK